MEKLTNSIFISGGDILRLIALVCFHIKWNRLRIERKYWDSECVASDRIYGMANWFDSIANAHNRFYFFDDSWLLDNDNADVDE